MLIDHSCSSAVWDNMVPSPSHPLVHTWTFPKSGQSKPFCGFINLGKLRGKFKVLQPTLGNKKNLKLCNLTSKKPEKKKQVKPKARKSKEIINIRVEKQ